MAFTRNLLLAAGVTVTLFTATLYLSCKKDAPEDQCQNVRCMNAGACYDGKCLCRTGYTGTYCEDVVSSCENITCQNGGYCAQGYCECPDGTGGRLCQTVYRTLYSNSYIGDGTDDKGVAYSTFYFTLFPKGTDRRAMGLRIVGEGGVLIASSLTLRLSGFSETGSTFTLLGEKNGDYIYSGSGLVSADHMSLSLREEHTSGGVRVYTFSHCIKY